jgi:predicted nucleotidyltransferase
MTDEHTKNGQEILELLRQEMPNLSRKFGVLSIGLFGSYVRGTQDSENDVDLLVEPKEAVFNRGDKL